MNNLIGIFELAIGRASGFGRFATSTRAFRISLAALMCVPAFMALMVIQRLGLETALTIVLAIFCALLVPPVVTHALARLWQREAWWLRFAIAFNYARIAVVGVYAALLMVAAILLSLRLPRELVSGVIQAVMLIYTLWLDWFLLRTGLQISATRAALGVLALNIATFILVFGPLLLAAVMAGENGAFN